MNFDELAIAMADALKKSQSGGSASGMSDSSSEEEGIDLDDI